MSRQIRLEIPINVSRIYVKIDQNGEVRLFSEKSFTHLLVPTGQMIVIEVTVPDTLTIIEVITPSDASLTPINDIGISLIMWPYKDLESFSVIFDDREIKINVNDGIVDYDQFKEICEPLWWKKWALKVVTISQMQVGFLYWKFKVDK